MANTTPIFISPDQDKASQSAFLNENFRRLNDELSINNFDAGAILLGNDVPTDVGNSSATYSHGVLVDDTGIYAIADGQTATDANVRILTDGSAYFAGELTAATGTFIGSVTAATGDIGGWEIGATQITASGGSIGLDSTETDGDDVRLWAGDVDPTIAPFRVTEAGALYATSADIVGVMRATAGSVIATEYLDGAVALANLDIAAQGWSQTCIFSSTDLDTVAWAAGELTTADGTVLPFTMDAGDTGFMEVRTYIYFDLSMSTTVGDVTTYQYQVSSDSSATVGLGKILVATAINGTNGATFQVFGGSGGFNVPGESIVANSITGNEIAANTITADNLDVTSLSAITANMGDVTSGTIALADGGFLRMGMTDFHEGIGVFLGTALGGGPPVLSIGNSDPNEPELTWDNQTLLIKGQFSTTTPINIKAYATADLPGSPADTTTNSPSANANG